MVQEARCMQRARRAGIDAPLLLFVDTAQHRLYMERIEGVTVKAFLVAAAHSAEGAWRQIRTFAALHYGSQLLLKTHLFCRFAVEEALATQIGMGIAALHATGIAHGDLTTSNLMLRGATLPQAEAPVRDGGSGTAHSASFDAEDAPAASVLQRLPPSMTRAEVDAFAAKCPHKLVSPGRLGAGEGVQGALDL
jgi:hypothetical protein